MIEPDSLEPGERLLWRDTPDVATYCKRRGVVDFQLSIVCLALGLAVAAYAWFYGAADSGAKFWWLPALFGAGLLSLPLRVRRNARRTSYALTDRRAIIENPGVLLRNRVSVPFSDIKLIEVRNGQFGDILFRDFVWQGENGLHITRDGFLGIANVREVEQLLRSAIEKATGRPAPDHSQ